jgi:hypothetical protein
MKQVSLVLGWHAKKKVRQRLFFVTRAELRETFRFRLTFFRASRMPMLREVALPLILRFSPPIATLAASARLPTTEVCENPEVLSDGTKPFDGENARDDATPASVSAKERLAADSFSIFLPYIDRGRTPNDQNLVEFGLSLSLQKKYHSSMQRSID